MATTKTTKTYPRADLIEKAPTPLQERFVAYIERETGYAPDMTTVVLFQSLRTPFQRSPENRADMAKRQKAAGIKAPSTPEPAKAGPAKAAPSKTAIKKATTTDVIEQAKAVERGELPSGSVVVKATGERSMATPGTPPKKAPAKRPPRKATAKAS